MSHTRTIKKDEVNLDWHIIDAKGIRLGKLATKCAGLLIGKHKVAKTTNMVNGDAVIVINAQDIDYHPTKAEGKLYRRHSGYIGGLKEQTLEEMLEKNPRRVIEIAVKGMLPKNKLGRKLYKNLHVYNDGEHPHQGQNPQEFIIETK